MYILWRAKKKRKEEQKTSDHNLRIKAYMCVRNRLRKFQYMKRKGYVWMWNVIKKRGREKKYSNINKWSICGIQVRKRDFGRNVDCEWYNSISESVEKIDFLMKSTNLYEYIPIKRCSSHRRDLHIEVEVNSSVMMSFFANSSSSSDSSWRTSRQNSFI